MSFGRRRLEPMPAEFKPLANYNAEVARGLVHTEEWRNQMAGLQHRFNVWTRGIQLAEFNEAAS